MLTVVTNANIFTPLGTKAKHGTEMGSLHHIPNGQVEIEDGIIRYAGPVRDHEPADRLIDAGGNAVLPGFVDSHTHLVFGGYRPDEFMWRMRGDTYMSIMERGGGIANTMRATRETNEDELFHKALEYLHAMHDMGVTTVEAKSGYGMDRDTELKQLRVIGRLASEGPINVVSTYLGAHAVPPDYKGREDEYIDFMITEMLDEAKPLAEFCDVFCEKGVFSIEQSRHLLQAAKEKGYKLKLHADEIVNTGGAELAAELGAVSADHLLHISDAGIEALANSDTIATLLPITAFALREEYAPARKLIDSGCAVALASDFNPGSCFSYSIPLMIALACIHMRMSVEETITALTLNGAAALGAAEEIGSIEPGKVGNLVILDTDNINMLPYHTGINLVKQVIN
ncbi:MAG: imidazolonepropionase [Bacteroidales bacterium]|nr:imidazolonepropionase [Bacteroidales bacterium]